MRLPQTWLAGACALALAGAAAADPPHPRGEGGGREREAPQGRWEHSGPPGPGDRHWDRGPPPGGADRRWDRGAPPGQWGRGGPGAGPQGWDSRRYNGYWIGRRWYYGPPPDPAYEDPEYRPGFTPWRPGAILPEGYRAYGVDEYWRYHLRRPPRGYYWVQVGDEFLLISSSSGQIFDVVTGF